MSTSSLALSTVNQQMASLVKIIEGHDISPSDYSTSSFSVSPAYNYTNGLSVLVGQRASQTISIKVRKLNENASAVGALINALSKVNGITVNGVSFDQSNRELGVKQARRAAFDSAKEKADHYA
jgi:uncharacterized protein YggE